MRPVAIIAFLVGLLIYGEKADAHESRPLLVQISETTQNTYLVTWRIPPSAALVASPEIVMPETCIASSPPGGTQLIRRQLFSCPGALSGETIQVVFPDYNPSISIMYRLERLSGEKQTAIRSPKSTVWRIPDRESAAGVAWQYLVLGIEHILKGYDHLLFVACLMFIAGTAHRVLITITGFTVAHSVTLALAALELVRVPVPPTEAAIALSIVFLAAEIARDRRDTLTWRHPIIVAVLFGLLHGFGFASVLNEIGLPQIEVPAALLFFNIGVELGQIVFVLALIGLLAILRIIGLAKPSADGLFRGPVPANLAQPLVYVIGGLAVYWTIDRITGFAA